MLKFKPLVFQRGEGGDLVASEKLGGKRFIYQITKSSKNKFVVMHDKCYSIQHDTEEDAIEYAKNLHQEVMKKWFKSCKTQMDDITNHLKSIEFNKLEFHSYNPIDEPGGEPSGNIIYVARQEFPYNRQVTYYISPADPNGTLVCNMMIIDTRDCCPTKHGFDKLEDAMEAANNINSKKLMEAFKESISCLKFVSQFFKED